MSTYANKFLSNLLNRTVTKSTVTKVISGSLLQSIASFDDKLRQAANGAQQLSLPVKIDRAGYYDGTIICSLTDYFQWLGDDNLASDMIEYEVYGYSGNSIGTISLSKADVISLIEGELDVASIEAQIVPILTGLKDEVSSTTAWSAIEGVFSNYSSEPSIRLRDFVKFSLLNGQDVGTDLQTLILSFIDKTSDDAQNKPFKPSTAGDYTNTSGWGLIAVNVFTSIVEFIANLKVNFVGTFASIVDAWDRIAMLNARANMYISKQISYWFSTWAQDEYVTATSSTQSGSDFSISNGFVDLGVGFTASTRTQLLHYGLTPETAICLHTLGATWYVFYGEDNDIHLGFARHIYPKATADYIYNGIAANANTWDDVDSRLDGADFSIIKGQGSTFANVSQYNSYALQSIESTSKLIPAGLLALSGEDIMNRYYQDPDPTVGSKYRDMFVKARNDSEEITRSMCLDSALYAGSSQAATFAIRQISDYFDHLYSGVAGSSYSHTLETSQLPGSYRLMDDALTKDARITKIANVGKGIVAAATVVIVAVAAAKLKNLAFTSYVQAQRALYDTSFTPQEVRRMTRKASVLARLAGMTTEVAAYTVNDGVNAFTNSVSGSQEDALTGINDIKKLIAG